MSAEKSILSNKLSSLECELNKNSEEIRNLSGTGVEKILQAIKIQRWYFFKNKPKVLMDRNTGILWANLDYFPYCKEEGTDYSDSEAASIVNKLNIDNAKGWKIPTPQEL